MSENDKQQHEGDQPYDDNFYRFTTEYGRVRASIILPAAARFVHPRSVIDVGCAWGVWLEYWQKNLGVEEIFGIDGDYVDRTKLCIDEKNFMAANLEERINLDKRFDLVQCLEVGEHLTPERAESFVEDLTKLGDVILFSAAVTTAPGHNHVNCQWQSYWLKKFLKFGYVAVDCIRRQIWYHDDLIHLNGNWRQAMFIYVKSTELHRYPELQQYSHKKY